MTVIHYNVDTPAGRGIEHLLRVSALADVQTGLDLDESASHGGRTLHVAPAFEAWASTGEAALLLVVGSLAGMSGVRLGWALDQMDDRSKRAAGEAVLIAGGFTGHTLIPVPA